MMRPPRETATDRKSRRLMEERDERIRVERQKREELEAVRKQKQATLDKFVKPKPQITRWDFVELALEVVLVLLVPFVLLGLATVAHAVYFTGYTQSFQEEFVAEQVYRDSLHHSQNIGSSDFAEKICSKSNPATASALWRNSGGYVESKPRHFAMVFSEQQVAEIVRECHETHTSVKVVGGAHSFSQIATNDRGVMLSMDTLASVVSIDKDRMRVEVQAGMRLGDLHTILSDHGLALPISTSSGKMSVGGALATHSHGYSTRHGSLTSLVVGLRVVDGMGVVHACSESDVTGVKSSSGEESDDNADDDDDDEDDPLSREIARRKRLRKRLCRAARGGLGVLGIVTSVTLQCVKSFNLNRYESDLMPVQDFVGQVDALRVGQPYLYWMWVPYADQIKYVVMKNVEADIDDAPWKRWWDKKSNHFLDAVTGWEALMPMLTPLLHRGVAKLSRTYNLTAESHYQFELPGPPAITFMSEYFVPVEECVKSFMHVREYLSRRHISMNTVVLVSYVKGDDVPMSPFYHRDSCGLHIGFSRTKVRAAVAAVIHEMFMSLNARPHWGKAHLMKSSDLSRAYPHLSDFLSLRNEVDPKGVFLNDYMSELLGLD